MFLSVDVNEFVCDICANALSSVLPAHQSHHYRRIICPKKNQKIIEKGLKQFMAKKKSMEKHPLRPKPEYLIKSMELKRRLENNWK